MSLARTALRLAAVEALKADPVIFALCSGPDAKGDIKTRIYDSRMAEFDRTEPVPVIIVTTDDDQGEGFSANNGGAPFDLTVDLALEIAVKAWAVDEAGALLGIGSPATDREVEAQLDLIEERAVEALTAGETPQATLVRKVTRKVARKKSARFVEDGTGEKLAIRLVTLSASLKGEDRHVRDLPTGPFHRLPDPLRTVCEAMPAGSSARQTCQMIFDALPDPAAPPFTGADLALQPTALQGSGPPVRGDQPGGTPEIHDNTHQIP